MQPDAPTLSQTLDRNVMTIDVYGHHGQPAARALHQSHPENSLNLWNEGTPDAVLAGYGVQVTYPDQATVS